VSWIYSGNAITSSGGQEFLHQSSWDVGGLLRLSHAKNIFHQSGMNVTSVLDIGGKRATKENRHARSKVTLSVTLT